MKQVVLITGITGFLGSSIGKLLSEEGFTIVATKRSTSDTRNCKEFNNNITWIDIDNADWKTKIIDLHPEYVIHAAWIGVKAHERNDWAIQTENLFFLKDILDICKLGFVKKFVSLGSQAEYGYIDNIVKEDSPLSPNSAYGAIKIVASQIVEKYSNIGRFEWYWLRVFTVYGEGEGISWLLPSVITTMKNGDKKSMDFSGGEQQYSYLYIGDFSNCILRVICSNLNKSGIYNVSSSNIFPIKYVITRIRDIVNNQFELNFGALPYRTGQSMLVAGNSEKFVKIFGEIDKTPFDLGIGNTVSYYSTNIPL